jgi:molybdenum cofactor cytidylyltransferase
MTKGIDEGIPDRKIGIVLLAAGASVRMGSPKQLLKIDGVSMIRRAVQHALDAGCRPIVVVLGAKADQIAPEVKSLPVTVVHNLEWESGMSSSIRTGLKTLLAVDSHTQGVILFLGDQPSVTGKSLRNLATAHVQSGSEIVSAFYSNHIGTPALFSRRYFNELMRLEGQHGAKELLKHYRDGVLLYAMPEAACDLDTSVDYANFASYPRQ